LAIRDSSLDDGTFRFAFLRMPPISVACSFLLFGPFERSSRAMKGISDFLAAQDSEFEKDEDCDCASCSHTSASSLSLITFRMDDSWSWDGSLVSLHSSMAASTSSNPPSHVPSTSSLLNHSISLPPLAALKTDTSASYRPSYRVHTPPAIATRPPSPSSPSSSSFSDSAAPLPPSKVSPSLQPRDPPISPHTAHPLTSMLLADLSPPASPSPSLSSFPRSGSRSRISSSNVSGSRSGRGRTRTRRGSASSTVSTDGSAHGEGEEDSGTSSAEDSGSRHGGGLVMPSLTLDSGTRRSPVRGLQEERRAGPKVKLLVMGKTAEDRRTLATLLVNDHEGGGHHSSGVSDMSYSFLSTSHEAQRARSNSETSQVSRVSDNSVFSKLGCCSSSIALSHPSSDCVDIDKLIDTLRRPLEQLEAKLNSTYPTTESLTSLVCSAGAGEFDACLFLFSSRESLSFVLQKAN